MKTAVTPRQVLEVSYFEILDGAGAAQVEEIGSRSAVASSAALAVADVSEPMFHDDASRKRRRSLGVAINLEDPRF